MLALEHQRWHGVCLHRLADPQPGHCRVPLAVITAVAHPKRQRAGLAQARSGRSPRSPPGAALDPRQRSPPDHARRRPPPAPPARPCPTAPPPDSPAKVNSRAPFGPEKPGPRGRRLLADQIAVILQPVLGRKAAAARRWTARALRAPSAPPAARRSKSAGPAGRPSATAASPAAITATPASRARPGQQISHSPPSVISGIAQRRRLRESR